MLRVYHPFTITPQPDESTCGAASLHSLYRHFGLDLSLEDVLEEISTTPGGGTLAVMLGLHAQRQGFGATIYSCNLNLLDPTWFGPDAAPLADKLRAQLAVKGGAALEQQTEAYLDYLERGGTVLMEDVTLDLIFRLVRDRGPLIAGLSSTWLYRSARDRQTDMVPDDIAGSPTGHFLVVHGVDLENRTAAIADPYLEMPYPGSHYYEVNVHRLVSAILLGIVTDDAKIMVFDPPNRTCLNEPR